MAVMWKPMARTPERREEQRQQSQRRPRRAARDSRARGVASVSIAKDWARFQPTEAGRQGVNHICREKERKKDLARDRRRDWCWVPCGLGTRPCRPDGLRIRPHRLLQVETHSTTASECFTDSQEPALCSNQDEDTTHQSSLKTVCSVILLGSWKGYTAKILCSTCLKSMVSESVKKCWIAWSFNVVKGEIRGL